MEFIHKHSKQISLIIISGALAVFIISSLTYLFTPRYDTSSLYIAPRLGIVIDQNMAIVLVEKNSIAEKSGLKIGDKVTSLYQKEVYNIKEASDLVRSVRGGNDTTVKVDIYKEFPLEIERAGKRIPVNIIFSPLDAQAADSDVVVIYTTSVVPNNTDTKQPIIPTATTTQASPGSQDVSIDANASKQLALTTPTPVPEDMLYL